MQKFQFLNGGVVFVNSASVKFVCPNVDDATGDSSKIAFVDGSDIVVQGTLHKVVEMLGVGA